MHRMIWKIVSIFTLKEFATIIRRNKNASGTIVNSDIPFQTIGLKIKESSVMGDSISEVLGVPQELQKVHGEHPHNVDI